MGSDSGESRIVVIAALSANFTIMVAKFVAALATGSSAMFSEGIHSAADTSNQGLLLLGEKRSRKPADDEHPFGYGQELYFWSLIVAVVLFGIGGGLSIYEGTHELLKGGAEMKSPLWNYVVLGVAVLAEGTSLIIAVRKFLQQKTAGEPFLQALRRSKDPKLFIPIGEDAAALAGIAVAFLGVLLSHRLGIPQLDSVASIVIGLILAAVSFWLAYETRGLLIGERINPELRERVRRMVAEHEAVEHVGRILTLQLAPDEILLNLELRFASGSSVDDAAVAVNRLEDRIREHDGRISRIFVEAQAPGEGDGREPPF